MYSGAEINNNKSKCGGGGLFIQGPRREEGSNTTVNDASQFWMYGGKITGNIADQNEGGGIHQAAMYGSYSYLFAGEITGNSTNTQVHWGGGGAFVGENSYMVLPTGAAISSNTAQGFGGGLAACSTGKIIVDDKVVMAANTGVGQHYTGSGTSKPYDQYYAQASKGFDVENADDFFAALYSRVPGTMNGISADWSGSVDLKKVQNVGEGFLTANQIMGLTNKASDSDKQTALSKSSGLIIQGNTSNVHGGGILVNGYLIGGDVELLPMSPTIEITAQKGLVDQNNNPVSLKGKEFSFLLKDSNGLVVSRGHSSGTLDKLDPIVFDVPLGIDLSTLVPEGQIPTEMTGKTITYTLEEEASTQARILSDSAKYEITFTVDMTPKFVMTYKLYNEEGAYIKDVNVYECKTTIRNVSLKKNGETIDKYSFTENNPVAGSSIEFKKLNLTPDGNTFTNRETPTKNIRVKKVWSDGADKHSSDVITVQLFRKLRTEKEYPVQPFGTVEISKATDWTGIFENLETVNDKNEPYDYEIQEVLTGDEYIPQIERIDQVMEKTAWVKVNTIQDGEKYLIVSKNSQGKPVVLDASNTTASSVMSSDTLTLNGKFAAISDGVNNYPNAIINNTVNVEQARVEAGKKTFSNGGNSKLGFTLKTSQGAYLRSENGYNKGIMLNSESVHLEWGGPIDENVSNGIQQDYRVFDSTKWKYNFDGTTFGSGTGLNNNVDLYKQITYSETEGGNTETWQITNAINKDVEYRLTVIKKAENTEINLPNAQFKLYKSETGNDALRFIKDGSAYKVSDGSNGDETLVTDERGSILITGLKEQTLYLEETQAPNGYVKRDGRIKVDISRSADSYNQSDRSISITVYNPLEYYELPETGGSGTMLYKAAGSAMILAAISLYGFNRKKRREGED